MSSIPFHSRWDGLNTGARAPGAFSDELFIYVTYLCYQINAAFLSVSLFVRQNSQGTVVPKNKNE